MWTTPLGDRTLRGPEAKLFQAGLASLLDCIDKWPGEAYTVGTPLFDALSVPEKLAILEQAARALLMADVPCPQPTAVLESAVGAVYYQLIIDVDAEAMDGRTKRRKLIRKVADAHGLCEEDTPAPDSTNPEQWEDLVNELLDLVLWDRDWDDELIGPDDPPDLADDLRDKLDIPQDYYAAAPPDPRPERIPELRRALKGLCMMKVP